MIAAQPHDSYHGKRVHRFPVRVQLNDSRACMTVAEHWHSVISTSAATAADYVRSLYLTRPETEITVYGPKGGQAARRFIGWYTSISHQLMRTRPDVVQPPLPFSTPA